MRLNKFLSEAGVCSRREADRLILSGKVTVDGKRAAPGMQVDENNVVKVGNKQIHGQEEKVVLAVYKPRGIICTEDMRERKNIVRFLNYPVRITYAGRLDKDSEGLIFMTNDGTLINAMMRARYGHEKEYHVTVDRPVTEKFLQGMRSGVHIQDEEKGLDTVTRPCQAQRIGKYTFSIVLTQGLNRQIRRMCRVFGYQVKRLVRVRIMNVTVDGLKPGEYRKLTKQELEGLYGQTENRPDAGACESAE